jgi:hypothetical protein
MEDLLSEIISDEEETGPEEESEEEQETNKEIDNTGNLWEEINYIQEAEDRNNLNNNSSSSKDIFNNNVVLYDVPQENIKNTTLKDMEYGKYEAEKFIEDLILENAYENNLCSDISNIKLTKYFTDKNKILEPITPPFLDNIIFYKLFSKNDGKNGLLYKDVLGFWNTKIRRICDKFNIKVVPHSVKFKKPVLFGNELEGGHIRTSFKELTEKKPEIIKNFLKQTDLKKEDLKNCYIGICKLELADEDFNTIHNKLELLQEELAKYENQIFVKDVDITADFSGTFDKNEIIDYLLKNENLLTESIFYMQQDTPPGDDDHKYIILDNTASVSAGTLTFLETKNGKILNRYKIYNKVFAQFSSPGVQNTTGHHLLDFLNCPDARLKNTFANEEAKKRGITRLEITIYKNSIPKKEEMEEVLNFLYGIIKAKIFYYVPIKNLWTNLTEHIQNNLIVVNRKARLLYIIYYTNLQTKKIIGSKFKIPHTWQDHHINNCLLYSVSNFSYEVLPCYLLEIENSYKENYEEHYKKFLHDKYAKSKISNRNLESGLTITNINLLLKEYQKPKGGTQLSRASNIYNYSEEFKKIDIEEAGLINTDFISFYLLKCKGKICDKPKFTITQKETTKKEVSILSKKKREKRELEKKKTALKKNYIEDNKKPIEEARQEYIKLKEELKQLEEKKQNLINSITSVKKAIKGVANSLKNATNNQFITVIAFLRRVKQDGTEFLIILRKEDFTPYYAPQYLTTILNNNNREYPFIHYGDDIYGLDAFTPIIKLEKNGLLSNGAIKWRVESTINNKLKTNITMENIETKKTDVNNRINKTVINILDFPTNFKLKDSINIDTLNPNTEYKITHLGKLTSKKDKERFYFKVEGSNEIYRTNTFIDQYLSNLNNPILLKFKTLNLKNSPVTKKKEMEILTTKIDQKNKISDLIFNQ